MSRFRDPYRPERHYMRGPGPKWHAKHTAALAAAAGVQPIVRPDAPRARFRAGGNSPMARIAGWTASRIAGWFAPTAAAAMVGFVAVMALA